ncbi:methionine-rich copper-binding protein CopC [Crossiella equi]|uniref:Methionine-rich copper-binding protein CopC n=1 Tax=Crossiella equi TaxID=130796 RepID=A0ABS5AQK4_9PSEU|nr:copper resistance CopC family protein [Crossiella equi]MBP2478532.1 methionine-rich copper-binding protein CopC [Crossiella equi]
MVRLAVVTLVAALTALGPGPALTSSSPQPGSEVRVAPSAVRLTFDQPVTADGPHRIEVTGPDGRDWAEPTASVRDNEVTAPLRPLGAVGVYHVRYQVSVVGAAPLVGEFRFALSPLNTLVVPSWVWLIGLLLFAAVGLVVLVRQYVSR